MRHRPIREGCIARFFVSYRMVNIVPCLDVRPLPQLHDVPVHIKEDCYFATLDLLTGLCNCFGVHVVVRRQPCDCR